MEDRVTNLELLVKGPHRVLISAEKAVSCTEAAKNGIVPVIIFVRDDGWTLGAPLHLVNTAAASWEESWQEVVIPLGKETVRFPFSQWQFRKETALQEIRRYHVKNNTSFSCGCGNVIVTDAPGRSETKVVQCPKCGEMYRSVMGLFCTGWETCTPLKEGKFQGASPSEESEDRCCTKEIDALSSIVDTFKNFDQSSRRRMLNYLNSRFF